MDDKRVDEVVFVAPVAFDEERKKTGWSADVKSVEKYKVQLIVNPSHVETINLLEKQQANSWHVFCGIRADAFVFKVLKMSLKYQLHRAMVTELPNTYDFVHNIQNAKPLCLHRIRFFLQDRKYAKKIEKVFADVLKAEDCIVRGQFISGTHALTVALFAFLRPGDTMLSINGKPYDTLDEVIGIAENPSSLKSFGVKYEKRR